MYIHTQYTLPTVEFVGGATQELSFSCYHSNNNQPSDLSSCTANFAIISYVNKYGTPLVSKTMQIRQGTEKDGRVFNVLHVTLNPGDTVNLQGKFIYQVTVKDVTGLTEIPGQGVMHINNNINKQFIS